MRCLTCRPGAPRREEPGLRVSRRAAEAMRRRLMERERHRPDEDRERQPVKRAETYILGRALCRGFWYVKKGRRWNTAENSTSGTRWSHDLAHGKRTPTVAAHEWEHRQVCSGKMGSMDVAVERIAAHAERDALQDGVGTPLLQAAGGRMDATLTPAAPVPDASRVESPPLAMAEEPPAFEMRPLNEPIIIAARAACNGQSGTHETAALPPAEDSPRASFVHDEAPRADAAMVRPHAGAQNDAAFRPGGCFRGSANDFRADTVPDGLVVQAKNAPHGPENTHETRPGAPHARTVHGHIASAAVRAHVARRVRGAGSCPEARAVWNDGRGVAAGGHATEARNQPQDSGNPIAMAPEGGVLQEPPPPVAAMKGMGYYESARKKEFQLKVARADAQPSE